MQDTMQDTMIKKNVNTLRLIEKLGRHTILIFWLSLQWLSVVIVYVAFWIML